MDPADLSYLLPRHLYFQVVHALRLALPPPASDQPQDGLHRDRAAIAQVAAMLPANAEEAMLAAQVVAAGAQALDCLRLLRHHAADGATGFRCTAQAATMMRQANAARSLLMRIQTQRQKREARNDLCDAAASLEHCAIGLMSDALHAMPIPPHPPASRDAVPPACHVAPVASSMPTHSTVPCAASATPDTVPEPCLDSVAALPSRHQFAPRAAPVCAAAPHAPLVPEEVTRATSSLNRSLGADARPAPATLDANRSLPPQTPVAAPAPDRQSMPDAAWSAAAASARVAVPTGLLALPDPSRVVPDRPPAPNLASAPASGSASSAAGASRDSRPAALFLVPAGHPIPPPGQSLPAPPIPAWPQSLHPRGPATA